MTGFEAAAARAAAGASVPVAKRLYRWWRPKSDWASLTSIADSLAAAVDHAEQKVQRELRAEPGAFMPVRFTVAAHPQPEAGIGSAEVDEIAVYFDLLEQPRRLVVLGGPGAGKTVAATYLARGLIERRNELISVPRRTTEPVPVRLNTAGWDGGRELTSWLVSRLGVDYELPAKVAEKMLEAGMILPILDGLDEMDDDTTDGARARALLDRLNERDWAHRPVVVLCRSVEFDNLAQVGADNGLHGAGTVTIDPLTANQPAEYLAHYRHRIGSAHPVWDRITTHLRVHADSPLAVTLRTPWMLGLTATTLHRTPQTAEDLLDCPTAEGLRDGLLGAQIPAAIAGTKDTEQFRDYTIDNVERWLRTLALHLQHRRDTGRNGTAIRLDEIWEIAGAARARLLHGMAAMLLTGLVLVLVLGCTLDLTLTLAFGLSGGLVCGLTVALTRHPIANRIAWKVPTRRRWPSGLAAGAAGALVLGLSAGISFRLSAGLVGGVTVGLAFGALGGLAAGVVAGLRTTVEDQLAIGADGRRLIRDDLHSALFHGAIFGLTFGLVVGVSAALAAGPASGLAIGLTFGLMIALAYGLGSGRASGRHFVAVLLFKATADFPARPAVFLDWARDRGLLRINATAYQFRHQTYQQWLIDVK
ncbi:NACHT domain-containing protein [Nocardia asteroides]|uniref:NACHT domain-containing protein n=1 Tax=Nocardia asteroides TaxID=1824 RepID=UPI00364BD7EA